MATDRIYAQPLQKVGDFVFDERVVEVFPDMISRSVPGYASVIAMTAELAEQFVTEGSNVYDLGCSLGAATLPMSERIAEDATIVAIDSSPAMTQRLGQRLAGRIGGCPIRVVQADVRDVEYSNASFMVMNFTLQFIPLAERETLLSRLGEALRPGGGLLLSEKIGFADSRQQELMTTWHHAFKRAHGYSELEIAQKRTALENTLMVETSEVHTARLLRCGFSTVTTWFQCFNFASFIAIKA